jgi:hypothetical protein
MIRQQKAIAAVAFIAARLLKIEDGTRDSLYSNRGASIFSCRS